MKGMFLQIFSSNEDRREGSRPARVSFLLVALVFASIATSRVFAVTAEELKAQLDAGDRVTIIDVRENIAFRRGHIPGAINVPAAIVQGKRLPPLGDVIVYGDGVDVTRTRRAMAELASKPGIRPRLLEGGFERWTALGNPGGGKRGLGRRDFQFVTYDQLRSGVTTNPSLVLVDVRSDSDRVPSASDVSEADAFSPDAGQISVGVVADADRGGTTRFVFAEHDRASRLLAERFPASRQLWFSLPEFVKERLEHEARAESSIEIVDVDDARAVSPFSDTEFDKSEVLPTDLSTEFPGIRVIRSEKRVARSAASDSTSKSVIRGAEFERNTIAASVIRQIDREHRNVYVLIDDGDGSALEIARRLHAAGVHRIRILTGGETLLRRRGAPLKKTIRSK